MRAVQFYYLITKVEENPQCQAMEVKRTRGAKKTRPQNCYAPPINRGRISSVGRGALVCRAGGRGFDSRGRTNTQGLKKT